MSYPQHPNFRHKQRPLHPHFEDYHLAKQFIENYFNKELFGNEKISNFKDIYKKGYKNMSICNVFIFFML